MFECNECNKKYVSERKLIKHLNEFHNSNESSQVLINQSKIENVNDILVQKEKISKTFDINKDKKELIEFTRKQIDNIDFTDWSITKEQVENELVRIQSTKDSRVYRKAILWYIYGNNLRLSEFKDLPFIDSIVRVYGTNKAFILLEPVASKKGKPIYAVRDDFPISISLEMVDYNIMREKIMTPNEIDSILFSNIFAKTFKQKRFDKEIIAYFVLTNAISILTVCLIFILRAGI